MKGIERLGALQEDKEVVTLVCPGRETPDGPSTGAVRVEPASGLRGVIRVPGDKSISHRAVIMGAMAEGETVVEGFLAGLDTLATLDAFRALGVNIDCPEEGRLVIRGSGAGGLRAPSAAIDARNSGTTARLLAGLLSSVPVECVITGDDSLRKRPMARVVDPLRLMGADIVYQGAESRLPLRIRGARLKGIEYATPVPSAQVKSALLLAGLNADGPTTVVETAVSRDHTERMLRAFGAEMTASPTPGGGERVTIEPGVLKARTVRVPGDISSAAFFMAAAAVTPGSEIVIENVGVNSTRTGILTVLGRMGARIGTEREDTGEAEVESRVEVAHGALKGIDLNGAELLRAIDEFPVICVLAAFAHGTTTISGAGELRVKESDRIEAMAGSLKSIGAQCVERPDGIVIEGTSGRPLRGGRVESRGDHRIAMAMAVAALNTESGIEIDGASCADVSFPGFFGLLDGVRR